jgi:hypothetical protein
MIFDDLKAEFSRNKLPMICSILILIFSLELLMLPR